MEELEVTQPQRTREALGEARQVPAEGVSLRPPGGREGGVCCQLSAVLWGPRPPLSSWSPHSPCSSHPLWSRSGLSALTQPSNHHPHRPAVKPLHGCRQLMGGARGQVSVTGPFRLRTVVGWDHLSLVVAASEGLICSVRGGQNMHQRRKETRRVEKGWDCRVKE